MQTIGNYLKSGREARNIRLSEVARSTKISKWYLDCLEKDEFDKIPGGPYIKGYIASYATFLGMEEDEVLKRYDSLQISSADENEIQDHPPQDIKRKKLKGFSFGKKNLVLLSMAVLILLAIAVSYFFFQNQTHIAAQTQDAKMQPSPSSKIKQVESHPKFKDDTGIESLAILPTEQDVEGSIQANVLEEIDSHSQKVARKEPVINKAQPSSVKENIKRPAPADSKHTFLDDTPGMADPYLESVPGYQTADTRLHTANNMRVIRAVASSDVVNKDPAGLSNSFQWSMEKVYIWTMIECEQPPSSIRHTYYFKGQIVNDVELEINSPQWRTWSYKNLLDKRYIGQWKVDITSDAGELLQRVFFEVN